MLKNIEKITFNVDERIYMNIDLNSLISYSAFLLKDNNIPITFENLYVVTFLMFPKRFCLVNFPDMPDGARINRSILQCLPKYQNLLTGNAKQGYSLTNQGLNRVKVVSGKIKTKYISNKRKLDVDSSKRTLNYNKKINELKQKSAYLKFEKMNKEDIGIDSIFDFLEISPYSNKTKIRDKLNYYNSLAKYGKSREFENFIKWILSIEEFKVYLR